MLSYQDVIGTPYTPDDQFPTLTPEALTLLAFLLEYATSGDFWTDYETYHEEIENSIAATMAALMDGVS